MSLNPRAVAIQGLGFTPRLVAVQGLWPAVPRFDEAGANVGARRRRRALEARLEELDQLLREHERRQRRGAAAPSPSGIVAAAPAFAFRTNAEAAARVAGALAAVRAGVDTSAETIGALRGVLEAARQRVADEAARRRKNRWRAVLLAALWMLSW